MEDLRFLGLLGNTFGIFLAEQCFGISFRRISDQKELPTRLVAEMLVYFALDTLPTLGDFFRGMPLEAWVSKGARRLSEELADPYERLLPAQRLIFPFRGNITSTGEL